MGAAGMVFIMLVAAVAAAFGLWLAAMFDVVRDDVLDPRSRAAIGVLLVVAAPLGVLVWAVLRTTRSSRVTMVIVATLVILVPVVMIGGITIARGLHGGLRPSPVVGDGSGWPGQGAAAPRAVPAPSHSP